MRINIPSLFCSIINAIIYIIICKKGKLNMIKTKTPKLIIAAISVLMLTLALCACGKEVKEDNFVKVEIEDISGESSDISEPQVETNEVPQSSTSVYDEVLENELNNPRYGETSLNYGYGNVNDDSVQELFIIRGNSHIDTVTIYTYDTQTDKAVYVGDFGGWGYCDYIPNENSIISAYGNQGYFYIVETGMDENYSPYVKDVILRNNDNKTESFYGFTLDDFNGSMGPDDYDINMFSAPGEQYLISEDEADLIEAKMRDGSVRISTNEICVNVLRK